MEDLVAKAKRVIEESMYVTLATASKDGVPGVAPLYTGHDEAYNFYFSSSETSQHVRFLQENNKVALVIFNSMVPRGKGEGVYIEGTVCELTTEEEVQAAYPYFYGRNDATPHEPSYYLGESGRKLYKIVPTKMWMNGWEKVDGIFTDVRLEIPLLKK